MTTLVLTIGELARQTQLSAATLRFYEAAGVLRPIRRAANGHRQFHASDVSWIEFVLKLKAAGMPLADIRRYAELRAAGDATLASRLAMLAQHRLRLAERQAELVACAAVLDHKMGVYQALIDAQPPSPDRPHHDDTDDHHPSH
jgi:DNA-binding transcriptional MerR regulator